MIEVKVPYVFCAFHLILICTLDSFGHHALKCAIDGPRVENYTSLSLKHDKGCSCKHCLVNALTCSVCPLLQQKSILQEGMADRLSSVPVDYKCLADGFICGQ